MIQRIQTVFLFLGALLLILLAFFPIAELLDSNYQIYSMTSIAVDCIGDAEWESAFHVYPLGLMLFVLAAGALFSIFLFKKRVLQARIAMLLMMLAIVWPALVYLYASLVADALNATFAVEPLVIVSLLAALLFFMARRRILMDEALVKSYDRLR